MKKLLLVTYIALCTAFAFAQETMYIMKTDGGIDQHLVSEVDSLIFYAPPPPAPVLVSGFSFNQSSVTMFAGETLDLSGYLNILPAEATDKTVAWSAPPASTVSVNSTTGIATAGTTAGNTTITATTNDGSNLSASITVTVSLEAPKANYQGIIPNAVYMGRWEKVTENGIEFDKSYYHGSMIKVKFTGTTAKLNIPATNGYDFIYKIDNGDWESAGVNSGTSPAIELNLTPSALSNGEHNLTIIGGTFPNTGLNSGKYIKSLNLLLDPGATTLAPDLTNKYIEFIGDSISTIGYGVTLPEHWNFLVGEDLGIIHSHIAEPGINLGGMATQYFNTYNGASAAWDFQNSYHPDVIIVNLGQNGGIWSPGPYKDFLLSVRVVHPDAIILALALFSEWPTSPMQAGNIEAAVDATGDSNIYFVGETIGLTQGEDVHPNLARSRAIANVLTPIVAGYLGL